MTTDLAGYVGATSRVGAVAPGVRVGLVMSYTRVPT